MFSLATKIALVTGAGSGIGAAVAQTFASAGARVVIADIQPDAATHVVSEIVQDGGTAGYVQLDVTDEASVRNVVQGIVSTYGRLDIAVNNAGISHVGNILETSLDDWERTQGVNARGVFLCAREEVRGMLAQTPPGSTIINMASVAAQIAVDRRCAYSASKGAVLALTRSIAGDFAQQGIRCNALCPGTVDTPFIANYLARNFAGREAEQRLLLHARQPVGRMGTAQEIAAAALYLASDEAAFVTGSALVIDGGWTAK